MKKIFVILAIAAGSTFGLQAQYATNEPTETAHFQASLTPNLAIYPRTTQINGLSLNIWGENPQHGIALGIVNGSTGESMGFTWGFVNYAESYTGVAWGFINVNTKDFIGWQEGLINVSFGHFTGFQSAFINYSKEMRGLQWGAVNYTEELNGVQIGFLNIALNNPLLTSFPRKLSPVFPFVNWSF